MLKSLEEGQQNHTKKNKRKKRNMHTKEKSILTVNNIFLNTLTQTYVRPMTYRYTDKKK